MLKKLRLALPLLALLAVAAGGCTDVTNDDAGNLVELLATSTNHGTLRTALQQSGLNATLESKGPYTLFAPTDAAFAKLPTATRDAIFGDPAKLAAVMRHQVVEGKQSTGNLSNGEKLTTLQGQQVTITKTSAELKVNDANIVLDNLGASNGVIHVTDTVLIPAGVL